MKKRLFIYILGLFIMTIGVSFSIKSNLGVSPVSSIPYTITLLSGIEMGKATILFHMVLILLQIIILGKDFKMKNINQVIVAIIFGYFTTFSNDLMTFLPTTENYAFRLMYLFLSIIFVAIGIFLYLPSDIVPLAGDGAMQAVSQKNKIAFPKVKVGFDISMVVLSTISCWLVLQRFGSVGVGTMLSALLVGIVLNFIMKSFRKQLDSFLSNDDKVICYEE